MKQTRFASLTDQLITYGPRAAQAVLAYLEQPANRRTRQALSSKSREGLAWVLAGKGDPPLRLKYPLEYLLFNLKTSGVDLDDIYTPATAPLEKKSGSAKTSTVTQKEIIPSGRKFPPLPKDTNGRLELLRKHFDSLEALGMEQSTFEERRELALMLKRLQTQSPHLRDDQRATLYVLYEQLRQGDKGALK